ncbi:hypothetical protein DXG03_000453 [Asterophora parasitica]|uniref:Probable acetate kinase n=1 Tax=Asterophora parasitica TaxID=117018 RepID=A0A9P7KEA5_9AGAR|nr:hypothetical protein DXG03_000453 [Asterophora parasitica]
MSLILSLNAGSSSLKISLYRRADPVELILTSSITNISTPSAKFSFDATTEPAPGITNHADAFAHFLSRLASHSPPYPPAEIRYICHRVVHGGAFTTRTPIDASAYDRIAALSDLAPLHNGAALSVIKACIHRLPTAHSVAYFDSAFHASIPRHISTYAIDQDVAAQRGLKKYGFHGLSFSFILRATSTHLSLPASSLNLIVLHLGSGASACAISSGSSLDTSMGLTPLSGLPGATRSGTVDPSLIFHYTNTAGRMTHDPASAVALRVTRAEEILNRGAGWNALAGTTDFGRIVTVATRKREEGKEETEEGRRCKLAFDLFVDRVLDFVGAYHLKLGGEVDALVFAGGIGERSVELRRVVAQKIECLGYVRVDERRNGEVDGRKGVVFDIGVEGEHMNARRAKKILVCRTDEQVEMARSCALDDEFWGSESHQ